MQDEPQDADLIRAAEIQILNAQWESEHPDYHWLVSHINGLAHHLPEIFLGPQNEMALDGLATALAESNFMGALFMGGEDFMIMMLLEYRDRERYEEAGKIKNELELHAFGLRAGHAQVRADNIAKHSPPTTEKP